MLTHRRFAAAPQPQVLRVLRIRMTGATRPLMDDCLAAMASATDAHPRARSYVMPDSLRQQCIQIINESTVPGPIATALNLCWTHRARPCSQLIDAAIKHACTIGTTISGNGGRLLVVQAFALRLLSELAAYPDLSVPHTLTMVLISKEGSVLGAICDLLRVAAQKGDGGGNGQHKVVTVTAAGEAPSSSFPSFSCSALHPLITMSPFIQNCVP